MAFDFPNPVNEVAARVVAGLVVVSTVGVVAASIVVPAAGLGLWLVAAGFALRVGWGPRYSPFGVLATRVIAPRLGAPRLVAGPPKRFAQAIGLIVASGAALAATLQAPVVAWSLAGVLVVAASLEAFAGFCIGCTVFAGLIRVGLVPRAVCESCADVTERLRVRSAALASTRGAVHSS